jgi:hypothetical protein
MSSLLKQQNGTHNVFLSTYMRNLTHLREDMNILGPMMSPITRPCLLVTHLNRLGIFHERMGLTLGSVVLGSAQVLITYEYICLISHVSTSPLILCQHLTLDRTMWSLHSISGLWVLVTCTYHMIHIIMSTQCCQKYRLWQNQSITFNLKFG